MQSLTGMKIDTQSVHAVWIPLKLESEMPIICTLCLREKKQEMRLSLSMMQTLPCSFFLFSFSLERIMNSSRLGTTACQAGKIVEQQCE